MKNSILFLIKIFFKINKYLTNGDFLKIFVKRKNYYKLFFLNKNKINIRMLQVNGELVEKLNKEEHSLDLFAEPTNQHLPNDIPISVICFYFLLT